MTHWTGCILGAYFMRKKSILGLSTGTERVHVKLDEDGHTCVLGRLT